MLFRIFALVAAAAAGATVAFGPATLWLLPVLFVGYFLALVVLAVVFLGIICFPVNLDKPQEQDSPFYRRVMYVFIEAIMNGVLVRLHTQGL